MDSHVYPHKFYYDYYSLTLQRAIWYSYLKLWSLNTLLLRKIISVSATIAVSTRATKAMTTNSVKYLAAVV